MSIQKILQYVGKIVYTRGREFYTKGNILSYNENKPEIIAQVKETGTQQYTVRILIDEADNIRESACTCPLWERCKHIAAVLIHYYNIPPDPELAAQAASGNTVNQANVYPVNFTGPVDPWIKSVVKNINDKYIHPVKDQEDRKWKLFFRIKYVNTGFREGFNWEISPVIRYVKKDNTLGGIYNYSLKKELVELSQLEKAILYRLLENEEKKDLFIYYIDLFIHEPTLPLLLVSGYKYQPVTIGKIRRVRLGFSLAAIEKGKLQFRSYLELFYNQTESISTSEHTCHAFKQGANLYFLFKNGYLLSREDNISFAEFLLDLTDKVLLPQDIDYIRNFTQEHFKEDLEIDFQTAIVRIETGIPEPVLELSGDIIGNTNIHVSFRYKDKKCSPGNTQTLLMAESGRAEVLAVKRDFTAEKSLITFFEQLTRDVTLVNHYKESSDYKTRISVSGFIVQYGTELMDNGFTITMGRNKRLTKNTGRLSLFIKSGISWFDLEMRYLDADGKVTGIRIEDYDLASGLIQVDDRFILLKKEDIDSIRKLQFEGINREGRLKVSKLNFSLLEEFSGQLNLTETADEILKYKEIYTKLKQVASIPRHEIPVDLNCTLRHYQQEGYDWLIFLSEQQISGCLADDMGLGKTVQTIALLQYLKAKGCLNSVLLVVPVTVIANWENELERFAPQLRCYRHVGKNRIKEESELPDCDIIIVSYQTLRIDIDFFNTLDFNYLILDESQNIKNAFTQTFKAIKTLKSTHRLALTGTPVENNTLELWSQMEFLNPGLLKSIAEFRKKYAIPIEEHGDKEAAERLKRIIMPFILRRRKEDVIGELPEKEIIVCYAEMNLPQREAYLAVRDYYQGQIRDLINRKGLKHSRFEIFNAILRLRQMVLFPQLADSKYARIESCKFEMLKEMLEEILAENHKILIFSQFVQVLQIIRQYLDSLAIAYCYIDGSTQRRAQEIRIFQEDDTRQVFLLSLKAGGMGVNLTAADYVILYDPWWNPAVEHQAIDRTHRIGQTRRVIGYKMIVKDSIEEKILKLQQKKADLVNKIIVEDKSVFKSLSEDDIIALFQ